MDFPELLKNGRFAIFTNAGFAFRM